MDGWDGQLFFCPYLESYLILFITFSSSFWGFSHLSEYSRKKIVIFFFQNISLQSKIPFFAKFFSRLSQIYRDLVCIFSSVFGPLRVMKTSFGNYKKMDIFVIKKFRNFKKCVWKISFTGISKKLPNISSWLFLVPSEELWSHILGKSKKWWIGNKKKYCNFYSWRLAVKKLHFRGYLENCTIFFHDYIWSS